MSDKKTKLPLILEGNPLPTNKFHISYSEAVEWENCSWRHKVHHIEKIDMDGPTEHTEFGKILHDGIEQYLVGGMPLDPEVTGQKIVEAFAQLPKFEGDVQEWVDAVKPIYEELPDFLAKNFQNYKVHSAEFELQEVFKKKPNRYFKGFIDAVLECEKVDKRLKEPVVEQQFWIIDHKTTSWGWTGDKKRDPQKQMQLVLYKHFWAERHNIPLEKIRCGWLLLKRVAKPGQHIELVPVSVGEKAIEKSLDTVYRMMGSIEKKIFVKNRNSCKYCPYLNTKFCT